MRRADVSSRAVMVNDVPAEHQSSEGVAAYFKKLFPSTFHRCGQHGACPVQPAACAA